MSELDLKRCVECGQEIHAPLACGQAATPPQPERAGSEAEGGAAKGFDPAYVLCPHGNDFVYECPQCHNALQSRYDRLREIADGCINAMRNSGHLGITGFAHNTAQKLLALDAEVRNG